MTPLRSVLGQSLSVMSALLVTGVAGAQTPASPPPQPPLPTIDEHVEVVATRLPEAPHDAPASVEVIDGDTLRATGAVGLRDALSLATGVEVAPGGDGGPAGAVPEFWGLREADAFLLVVDDIPWGGAFNPALTSLSLRDVERIEVVRGSAPVTYGATSFVGVIHVVHKAAAANTSYATVRAGSFTSGSGSIDLSMPSIGQWKSRVSADVERQGFKDDRTAYARGHALYRGARVEHDRKTWLLADLSWLGQDPATPHARQGAVLSSATPLDANYNPAGAFLDQTRISVAAGTERPVMGEARWHVNGFYAHSGRQLFRGFLTDISNAPNNATGFREDIGTNELYADTHLVWPGGPHLQVVAGGDFLFGNGEGRGATFTYTAPLDGQAAPAVAEPTHLNLDSGSRRRFAGAYALALWTPVPRLHVSTGMRLNVTDERRGEGAGETHVRPSGSAGAIFGLWEQGPDHIRVFGNYRDTFKPAAFDFSLAENERLLNPETARSYDGGVKVRVARGRLDLEASGFRIDLRNLVTATVVNGVPAVLNAGSTRFQGFELGADAHAAHAVSARVTYGFHDGRFVDFVQAFDGVPVQLAGKRFEMSARHLFSAGLIVAPNTGVVFDVIVKYTGDRFLDKRNTAPASPFATVDAGVGYRVDRWELRLDGRNLGDRRDPVSESELGDAQYYRLPARRLDLTFGVRF